MRKRVQILLNIGLVALVLISYAGLATTTRYQESILLLPIAALLLMPAAEWIDRKYSWYRGVTSTITLAFAISLFFMISVITLLDAVTFLVIYIQVYSLLHVKEERSYNHIVLMSFFLVLAATVMTPTPSIGLIFVLFVVATVWMLVLLEMRTAFAGSTSVVTVNPSRRAKPMFGFARRARYRGLDFRLAAWLSAFSFAVLALTSGMFFVSPRLEAGLLGRGDEVVYSTGLSAMVDLSIGGPISIDTTAVMHVVFPDEPGGRYRGEMFWRSTTLDQYTGTGWTRRGLYTRLPTSELHSRYLRFVGHHGWSDGNTVDRASMGLGRMVNQEIFLAQAPDGGLPSLSLVKSIAPEESAEKIQIRWDPTGDFTVGIGGPGEPGLSYRAVSEVYEPTPEELSSSSEDYEAIVQENDLDFLTRHNLLPKTEELVQEITRRSETAYEKVNAVQHWLQSNGFSYTYGVPDLPGEHPLDTCIHDIRSGHCELYASAMALMLRSIGIPTRVVSGYRGGQWNASDQSYTITADMAHLWVEVYFPDFGWVTFDPSPPAPEYDFFSISGMRRAFSRTTLLAKMFWYRKVVGFTPASRLELLHDVSWGLFGLGKGPRDGKPIQEVESPLQRFQRGFPLLAGVTAAVFLGFGALRLLSIRRGVAPGLSEDQQRAVRLRAVLLRRLRRLGIETGDKTVDELRASIHGRGLDDPEPVLTVLGAYNAVRFGARPLPAEIYAALRRMVRSLRLEKPAVGTPSPAITWPVAARRRSLPTGQRPDRHFRRR